MTDRRYIVDSVTDPETRVITFRVVDVTADVVIAEHSSREAASVEADAEEARFDADVEARA